MGTMTLGKKMGIPDQFTDAAGIDRSVAVCEQPMPNASDFDLALNLSSKVLNRFIGALGHYYAGRIAPASDLSLDGLKKADDYFTGDWLSKFTSNSKKFDGTPRFWLSHTGWMSGFEGTLLWGSVHGKWKLLAKDCEHITGELGNGFDHSVQERDTYAALAAFIGDNPKAEQDALIAAASAGRKKICKLCLEMLEAARANDAPQLNSALTAFLKTFKKTVASKDDLTRRVSFEATFFYQWALHKKLEMHVEESLADHIVRLGA